MAAALGLGLHGGDCSGVPWMILQGELNENVAVQSSESVLAQMFHNPRSRRREEADGCWLNPKTWMENHGWHGWHG